MTSLISNVFGLRPGEAISADMALETPQVMVRWNLESRPPDIDLLSIRRSTFRFPEDVTEGDVLLDEVPDMSDLRTSFADTTPDKNKVQYYSVFFKHKGPFSMDLNFSIDIERLGIIRGVISKKFLEDYWVVAREEGGDPAIWSVDTNKELIEEKIDLSSVISERDERVVALVDYVEVTSNRTFQLVTDRRFIEFTITDTATEVLAPDIDSEFDFLGVLTPGFEVFGATAVAPDFAVLDKGNSEVIKLSTAGAVIDTVDLSGLALDGEFRGLSHDAGNSRYLIGSGKVIYGIDDSTLAPDNSDVASLHPVRQDINSDFYFDETFDVLILPDDNLDRLQRYEFADLSNQTQIEEASLPGSGVYGLWKLDETTGPAVDSSGNAFTASVAGSPNQGVGGKFNLGIEFTTVSDIVDLVPSAASFDEDDGYVSFWWKSPYRGFSVSATRKLFSITVDGSNFIDASLLSSGDIDFDMTRGGTSNSVVGSGLLSQLDDGIYHHILVRWVGGVSGTFEVFVDNSSIGSVVIAGVWVGTPVTMTLGASSVSVLGFYDDVVLGSTASTRFTRYQLTTRGNRAHSLSGRDYDDLGQHWRDKFILEFEEYIVRNDFRVITLPTDKVLDDGEVLFREDSEDLEGGQLARLSRLFGLFLDRNVDKRKFFNDHTNSVRVEFEFIDKLGEWINAGNIDPSWNVDMRRRFLEVMYFSFQRSGTLDAFSRLVRFLGFRMLLPDDVVGPLTSTSRRFFDSVVDPDRPDVHFDTSFFDSGDDSVQLVTAKFRIYQENFRSDVGSASIQATRELTDAGADFLTDAEVGSMIIINDQDNEGDNGQYLITSIVSATVVVIDRDWPQGSNSGLSYRLHWRVPEPDPFNDQLLSRLNTIKVRWQKLEVII